MELTLVRLTNRRLPFWMPLLVVFSFILVAAVPIAAGGGERPVAASMYVNRTQASPGDNVTFWIWIDPLKEKGKDLVVTESDLDGFTVLSSIAPDTCLERQLSWVCVQEDQRSFAIEVHAVVDAGTDGRDLVNLAQVEVWEKNGHHDEEDRPSADAILLRSEVHVVAPAVVEEPQIDVQLTSTQPDIVPDTPMTYRVEVTNRGSSIAYNVSVVISVPDSIVLQSASRWPNVQNGQLTWILESVPVGSTELFFNATVPASNRAEQLELAVALTYEDANGGAVRIETKPSSINVLPVPQAPRVWPLQVAAVLAIIAFVGRILFVPPGPIGSALSKGSRADEIFLLHRSGILLKHFSPDRTRGMDSDVLGGMLAAVRMFVEDSMNPSAGPLQEIRFSGGSIVYVTGENAALAALNAKGNRARFANRAIGFLREFESLNGDALSNFDGVAGQLDGVDTLLTQVAS